MSYDQDEESFYYDVMYQVWLSGGNPDRIDRDRIDDAFWYSDDVDAAAAVELRHQRPHERIDDGDCEG